MLMRKKHRRGKPVEYKTPFGYVFLLAAIIVFALSFKLTDSMSESKRKSVQGFMGVIAVILLVASKIVDDKVAAS